MKTAVVMTKMDKVTRSRQAVATRDVRNALHLDDAVPLIPVSAHSGAGLKELWSVIDLHLEAK